jgi:hypothetical protein
MKPQKAGHPLKTDFALVIRIVLAYANAPS